MNLKDAKRVVDVIENEGIGYGVHEFLDDVEDEGFQYYRQIFNHAYDKLEMMYEDAKAEHGDALWEEL